MDVRAAFKEQFHAALAMLADCIRRCPADLWANPSPMWDDGDRIIYRPFWRIAFHAAYFAHLYLGQGEDAFEPWPARRPAYFEGMWHKPWDLEPFELPEDADPLTQQELLDYIEFVDSLVDKTVDGLDLETQDSGFHWYPTLGKLSHELLNLRHLQGHVGQLSELLIARGVDSDWISRVK
jgi:hypothetical protein